MSSSDLLSIKTSAPGKVILFGEHSVVYGKLAVAASLGLRTRLKLSESIVNNSCLLTVHLPVFGLNHSLNLKDLLKNFENLHTLHPDWTQPKLIQFETLVKEIDKFLLKNLGSNNFSNNELLSWKCYLFLFLAILAPSNIDFPSIDLTVETDLSVGAGTGSSASFAVCASAAFLEYLKHKSQNCDNVAKNGWSFALPKDITLGKFTKFELDLISKWAFCSEKIIHGTPSGLDNTICTFGNMVEFRKGDVPKSIQLSKKFQILLVNTKISRETHVYVLKVRNLYNTHKQVIENLLSACENIAYGAIDTILKIDKEDVDSTNFYEELNSLSAINHNILNALGVGHSKLDQIVSILKEFGLSAKLTGAGGGGYAYCFIPPFIKRRIVDEATKQLENNGFEVKLCDLGGEGVRVD